LASGLLPIALGEATKTVPFVMDGRKAYQFTVAWGTQTNTDDTEGKVIATSDARPDEAAIAALLPRFTGTIQQVPPAYSALKLAGERAYDLARRGETVELAARAAEIFALRLLGQSDADHAELEVETGKGVYVRSLGRDIAIALGTVAHIAALRRLAVGRFTLERAISLDKLEALRHSAAVFEHLLPIETPLDDIPALALTEAEAHRLRHGQTVVPLLAVDQARLDELGNGALVRATSGDTLVALTEISAGGLRPVRVLNL
jgi:tRNA pseudouridine55 synthase